jgi:hypothetical protein
MFSPAHQTLANELWALRSGGYAIRGHTLRKLDMGMHAFSSAPVTCVSPTGIGYDIYKHLFLLLDSTGTVWRLLASI